MSPWRGLKALVHDAVDATTELVREGHGSARRAVQRVTDEVPPVAMVSRLVDGAVGANAAVTFGAVKAVNRVVEALSDVALDASVPNESPWPPIPLRPDVIGTAPWVGDAALGVVNGAIGHHLAATGNGLDLGLRLRVGDRYLAADERVEGPRVAVWVHGLGTTEWCWALGTDDPFGARLERERGWAPVYARYNTGRRISVNGRALADALERHAPDGELALIGHSMGGLVSRAACHAGSLAGHRWVGRVRAVICLGSPHQGAPLARFGQSVTSGLQGVDLPATRVLGQILASRSAGIRDLERGNVDGADVDGPDPDATARPEDRVVPLLEGVKYAFLSATVTKDPDHVVSRWLGDLLVQVRSASGPLHTETFPIETGNTGGAFHHELVSHPAIYARIAALL